MPKEIPVAFHNGLNYDYNFFIKGLAKEFEREFNCLGENTEKCKTFSVPITKQVKSLYKPKHGRYYRCRLHAHKRVCKHFKIKNLGEYMIYMFKMIHFC